jgi:hypothetical protein
MLDRPSELRVFHSNPNNMQTEQIRQRIDALIELGTTAKQNRGSATATENSRNEDWARRYTQSITCLRDVFGEHHPYYLEFQKHCGNHRFQEHAIGLGILKSARADVDSGYLNGLIGRISAEVYSDIFDMATYLLESHLKDPAAIVTGIALEAHLRGLCKRHGIPLEYVDRAGELQAKKASVLNSELAKAGIYSKLDEKLIIGWQDLRNKAAHGQFSEYTLDQVRS